MTGLAKLSDIMRSAMPSEEELTEGAERRMAMVRPVLIDNWPDDVRALSMKTTLVPFDKALAVNLFDRKGGELPDGIVELAAEIDAICGFDHHFFRLNSRSPKDAPFPLELPVSCSGKEMLNVISCSERCLDDIVTFSRTADPLYICLREFIPGLRPDEELRCFVKDGELLAVAQYGFGEFEAPTGLREHVEEYWNGTLKPRMHLGTFVFDLWIGYAGPLLIELNPYGLSDPVGAGSYDRIEKGIPGIALRASA